MHYISTRGQAPRLDFQGVLLAGLARDGGLYVPVTWPAFDRSAIADLAGLPFAEAACRALTPYVGAAIAPDALRAMLAEAYAGFAHPATVPLTQIGPNDFLLELFHGPTLAFKDVAMQVLARMMDHVLQAQNRRLTIVGATSGDTGAAAVEAFRGREAVDVFILHPRGRISEVQRRQMTTVHEANVHNIALDGTFDDCQAILKGLFNDLAFRDRLSLAGVNSINWARVVAQTVYYFTAAVSLGAPHRPVAFSVPTGNFGDIYAGYAAARMGLPVARLVLATNVNDILVRTLSTGTYEVRSVVATQSPSMDIQVASNFERLLFDLAGRDGARISALMEDLAAGGAFSLDAAMLDEARRLFAGQSCDEEETTATMRDVHAATGQIIDPHTAVGVAAARRARAAGQVEERVPMVILATAHPAKFPDAVTRATGVRPALPAALAGLFERGERCAVLPSDGAAVARYIATHARAAREAAQ